MHASKKEINKKNIKIFLGAWTFHTRYRLLYGGIWSRPAGISGQWIPPKLWLPKLKRLDFVMIQNPTICSTVLMQQTVLQTVFMLIPQRDGLDAGSLCV